MLHRQTEGVKKFAAGRLQFREVRQGNLAQQLFSARGQAEHDRATIFLGARTADQALGLQAIGQFHRTVMLNLQAFGKDADGGNPVRRQALDRQQSLMLLGFQARIARCLLAEIQETPDFVAKVRQGTVVRGCF